MHERALRSFSRISSSDIFFFLVLSRGRGTDGPGAGLALGGLLGAPSEGAAGVTLAAVAVTVTVVVVVAVEVAVEVTVAVALEAPAAGGGEMGEVAASLVGGGRGKGSITERVYI